MKEIQASNHNLYEVFGEIQSEINTHKVVIVKIQSGNVGKWTMARLWRKWMAQTAEFMASEGIKMPLMFDKEGKAFGKRDFNTNDAHELFTSNWLGVDKDGRRLSWAKKDRDGMRAATKGERWLAMSKHDQWAIEKGIALFKPRDGDYDKLTQEQER